MDVVEHECDEYCDDDGDHGGRYIRLIEEQDDSQNKENYSHKSARQSVESIGDVDGIDDRNSDEEGDNRIKKS